MQKNNLLFSLLFILSALPIFAITGSINKTNAGCGLNNGTAKAIATGATSYNYLWSNSATTDSIGGLAVGSYSVTVYNATNTSDSVVLFTTIQTNAVDSINILSFQNDTVCTGKPISFLAVGNSQGGTYSWNGGNIVGIVTTPMLTTTPPSNETYTVRWINGSCNITKNISIVAYPVKATLLSVREPGCNNPSGQITCAAQGNFFNFTFLKNGTVFQTGQGTVLNTNVKAGNYTFIVNELITGCTDTIKNIVILDTASYPYVQSIAITNENCFGDNAGKIQVTLTGGTGSYTYKWSNNLTNNTNTNANLAAGSYTLSFNDGVCPNVDTIIKITGPTTALTVALTAYDDFCLQNIGSIKAKISGGTAPYTFLWSNGNSSTDSITNLAGNNAYTITVTDQNGCTVSATTTVNNSNGPTVSLSAIDTICPSATNGTVTVLSSSTSSFTYQWSHNATLTTATASNLAAGNYTVTVTSAGTCQTILPFSIVEYNASSIDVGTDQTIVKGQSATINVTSSAPITHITWQPNLQVVNNYQAIATPTDTTTYIATITYGKNCTTQDQITINVEVVDATINIPEIFSPNGDNINDSFYVQYKGIKELRVVIFDRWGNKVFEDNTPDFKWDGTNQLWGNQPLNTDVFNYVLEYIAYNNPARITKQGNIHLIK